MCTAFVLIIVSVLFTACDKSGKNEALELPEDIAMIDKETTEFLCGTWVVSKFLGFDAITKDDVEWPNGEKIIGKAVIIGSDTFSTKDFGIDYKRYAVEIKNPLYYVGGTQRGVDFSLRLWQSTADKSISGLMNEDVTLINAVSSNSEECAPALYVIDNNRLLISLNCDYFELEKETDNTLIPTNTSEPFVGHKNLDVETENFFYGAWKIEELLGFANSYNDASEYPTGQKVIGDEIIITKDLFSSKGLEGYNAYHYELKNPFYDITTICYNSDSFYRVFKIELPGLDINGEVKSLQVSPSPTELHIPISFFVVNNDRLILLLEATCFELNRIDDKKGKNHEN